MRMNQVLELKGRFEQKKSTGTPGAPKLPKAASVSEEHLEKTSTRFSRVNKILDG